MIRLPDWSKCLFDESHRYIVLRGGRGSAKSRSVARALIVRASKKPLRILCSREIQKSIKDSVKRLLDDTRNEHGLQDFYESTDTEIRGRNGSLFIFVGLRSNIESIKSMEGIDICWVEEASSCSYDSLKQLIPTIRKPGSQIIFTYNPRYENDPVDQMFRQDELPPRTHIEDVNYDRNPWFPDVLREEMEYDKARDYDKYLHVWEGQYLTNANSRVFKNWSVEEFEAPQDAIFRFGADFGFAIDPTVLVRCYIIGRKLYIDYEAHAVELEIIDTPELFFTIPESEKWPMTADSSRPETISHLRKHGFPKINASVKGANSVVEGIEWLKSFEILVHPRCKHTIDELTLYSYKTDPLTDKVLPVLEDKNNHVIDALRYACEGARRAQAQTKPKEFTPIPTASAWQ